MYYLLAMMTLVVLGTIISGIYLTVQPVGNFQTSTLKRTIFVNITLFVLAMIVLMTLGIQDVMAQPAIPEGIKDISLGMGLAIIGIGLPTAASTIAAGIAVGPVASAALAVIVEKPELFGRSLVYLGLAEGIAIYGLVVTILLLDKI